MPMSARDETLKKLSLLPDYTEVGIGSALPYVDIPLVSVNYQFCNGMVVKGKTYLLVHFFPHNLSEYIITQLIENKIRSRKQKAYVEAGANLDNIINFCRHNSIEVVDYYLEQEYLTDMGIRMYSRDILVLPSIEETWHFTRHGKAVIKI